MTTLGERLAERIAAKGISQAELARRVGVTQPAINHLIKRGSGGSSFIHKIARVLDTTPEYLTGEIDDPALVGGVSDKRLAFKGSPAPAPDTVELHQIDLAFGMGATYLDVPVRSETVQFSRAWLRHFTNTSPEHLFFAFGAGDSMRPTIDTGDLVLIDRSQIAPRMADQIWAIAWGDVGMIKRLRPMPDGTVKILSDNPSVPPDLAADGEMQVIGRVVAIVRKV